MRGDTGHEHYLGLFRPRPEYDHTTYEHAHKSPYLTDAELFHSIGRVRVRVVELQDRYVDNQSSTGAGSSDPWEVLLGRAIAAKCTEVKDAGARLVRVSEPIDLAAKGLASG